MKTKRNTKSLKLDRETVRKLSESGMEKVAGGTFYPVCGEPGVGPTKCGFLSMCSCA